MSASNCRPLLVLCGSALALALCASIAAAQPGPIPLSDVPASVLAQVFPGLSDGMWIVGPDGSIIASRLVDEISENPTVVYGLPQAGNPAVFGNYTILLEPDGSFSDIFGIADLFDGLGPTNLAFASDQEGIPSPFEGSIGGGAFQFVELPGMSGFWSASYYLNPAVFPGGTSAIFYSDIEPIPEPSTIVLCGLGALGVIIGRKRFSLSRRK